MKILSLNSEPLPVRGGAALSDLAMLKQLHLRHGFECHLATPGCGRKQDGIDSHGYRDIEELRTLLLGLKPQALLASLDSIYDAVRLSRRYGIPCLAYLHSYEYCQPTPSQCKAWKVGKPARPQSQCDFALRHASGLAVNSNFMRAYLKRRCGLDSRVLYPEFESRRFILKGRRNPDCVTGVCGLPHKGAAMFLQLAQAFPRQQFLLVGAILPRLRSAFLQLPNVEIVPYGDPRQFLRRTRVLIAPCQWAEPFGRMVVEAMANGIPVLVSRVGGLAEVVGEGALGVRAFRTAKAWIRELGELLKKDDRHHAALGQQRAARFLQGASCDALALWLGQLKSPAPGQRNVVWQGDACSRTAYAMINAHWQTSTAQSPCDLADVTVHHDYQQNFSTLVAPAEGKLVAVRTWDFGPYPPPGFKRSEKNATSSGSTAIGPVIRPSPAAFLPAASKSFRPELSSTAFAPTVLPAPGRRAKVASSCSWEPPSIVKASIYY